MSPRVFLSVCVVAAMTQGCLFLAEPISGQNNQTNNTNNSNNPNNPNNTNNTNNTCEPAAIEPLDACAEVFASCGLIQVDDGCGGLVQVDCDAVSGGCGEGFDCDESNECVCEADVVDVCEQQQFGCGEVMVDLGCGDAEIVSCGSCAVGDTCQDFECGPSELDPQDFRRRLAFGLAMHTHDDEMVVARPSLVERSKLLFGKGEVELFERDDEGEWSSSFVFRASPEDAQHDGSAFGWSVLVTEDGVFVGAPARDVVTQQGRVFESVGGVVWYGRTESGWSAPKFILPEMPRTEAAAGGLCGFDMHYEDGVLYVGCPGSFRGYGSTDPKPGRVEIFRQLQGGTFAHVNTIESPDSVEGDMFGASLAADGGVFAVGAPGGFDPEVGIGAGAVRTGVVYTYEMTPQLEYRSAARVDDAAEGDALGFAIDVDSNALVVGAPGFIEDGSAPDHEGRAFFFFLEADGKVAPEPVEFEVDGSQGDLFGRAVDAGDGRILIGAPNHQAIGATFAFSAPDGDISNPVVDTIIGEPRAAGDGFGWSVGLGDGFGAVGAPWVDRDGENDSGTVLVFPW